MSPLAWVLVLGGGWLAVALLAAWLVAPVLARNADRYPPRGHAPRESSARATTGRHR